MPGETDSWLRRNAGRLLREQWASPSALAQELYSILSDTQSPGLSASLPEVQERAQEAQPAPPEQNIVRQTRQAPSADLGQRRASPALPQIDVPQTEPQPLLPFTRRNTPDAAYKTGKPYKMDDPFPDWEWDLGVGGGSSSGTTTYIGQVSSGAGQNIMVVLYPSGSTGAAGKTVTVRVLQLDPSEVVPPGTWIDGIQQFSDKDGNAFYEVQIPVWVS